MTTRKYSIITGVSLILMAIVAIFAFGIAHSELVTTSSTSTFENIKNNPSLFNLEIIGWIIVVLLDLIVTITLYKVLEKNHKTYAIISGLLRLIYTFILVLAVYQLYQASIVNMAVEQFDLIQSFESIWSFGLILFGFHLFFTGLAAKGYSPNIITYLVIIAGLSYVFLHVLDSFTMIDTTMINMVLAIPMTIGELGLGVWLLIKGN